jgi:hypothetical protein
MHATSTEARERLSVELERALMRALRSTYEEINGSFFKFRLRRPVLLLVDSDSRLGRWISDTRTLELSRGLVLTQGWGVVVEVLKHEMAHQFVDEVLGEREEAAHGPAFRALCEERGIDSSASGLPGVAQKPAGDRRLLERISRLLALAESPNEHEAQAAMAAAQRLMLKYNVESVSRAQAVYAFRHLGVPTGRVSEALRILSLILGDFFFVEAIWVPVWRPLEGKRGSVLEVCGSLENLELAEYAYAFLTHTSERLWLDYKSREGIRRNAERRTFVAGVMAGFRDKLEKERKVHQKEGLVWVGDADLTHFFRARHPRVRWARYGAGERSDAYRHGREAGQKIVLHRGVSQGPSGSVRLLNGRRT